MIDIQQKKQDIIKFLEQTGPSLPVQIARAISMEPVFTSAILSELLSSKQITTSHLRIGSSPLYLLPTQKQQLEQKTEHLKPAEKETQEKLQNEKILFDEQETPATRIALRNIKDFATPFKHNDKTAWKYNFTPEEEIQKLLNPKSEAKKDSEEKGKQDDSVTETKEEETKENDKEIPKAWEAKKQEIKEIKQKQKKPENIFEKQLTSETKSQQATDKRDKVSTSQIKNNNKTFLQQIENFLQTQNTTISSIEEVDKTKVIAIIQTPTQKETLFAFNKKRITEKELFTCYKHSKKKNLPYQIITKDTPTKKMTDTIDAYKTLSKIQKLKN